MRICLICVEIFAWGKYGGFGRTTRLLGRELTRRGHEVFAVVPRRDGQRPVETLDGITVLSFPPSQPWESRELYRRCDADIYHSEEPSLGTFFAQWACPGKKHVITFRDPHTFGDWLVELRRPSRNRLRTLLSAAYEDNLFVRQAVRRADRLFCCAPSLSTKVRALYGLKVPPEFLASPISIPRRPLRKAPTPTVCFLGRWDRRKRPERFFALARQRPDVRFIAVGQSQDRAWDRWLRRTFGRLPNVTLAGFVDQFESNGLSELLEKSWILVNTSLREGLPTSFLEALAHRCAILSRVNPDGMAQRFGYHAAEDDFAEGLSSLLADDAWNDKGEQGFRYVHEHYELGRVVDRHLAVYRGLLNGSGAVEGQTA